MKNSIQYIIKYDTTKEFGYGLDLYGLYTEFPSITHVKDILRRSTDRDNILDYRFNEVNNTRKRRDNNKIIRYNNNNQENDSEEKSDTTRSKLGGYVIPMTSGTGSILLAGILNKSEDSHTVNTTKYTSDEIVQVAGIVDIYGDIDEGLNCDMEDYYFVVDYEEMSNFHHK